MRIERILRSNRLMKALTGLGIKEFEKLINPFEKVLQEQAANNNKKRQREIGGGRKHTLSTTSGKLFFILFYVKCYPTFDVIGFIFDVNRSQTNRWMHQLLPILEKTLGKELVLPERKIESVDEFFEKFPRVKKIFLDGTERPTQRPKDNEKQKAVYSGKQKDHTKKNLIVCDEKKKILVLSKTENGSIHDYKQFKESNIAKNIPPSIPLFVDLGFQGIKKDFPDLNVNIPDKKPRGGKLSNEQLNNNRLISSQRVIVEHAIGGVKRLNSVTHTYRNRILNTDDKLMLVSAGLWNFHLNIAA